MKIWRVSYCDGYLEHKGFAFFLKYREAVAVQKEAAKQTKEAKAVYSQLTTEIESFEIPATKEGILRALKILASHPDNG